MQLLAGIPTQPQVIHNNMDMLYTGHNKKKKKGQLSPAGHSNNSLPPIINSGMYSQAPDNDNT